MQQSNKIMEFLGYKEALNNHLIQDGFECRFNERLDASGDILALTLKHPTNSHSIDIFVRPNQTQNGEVGRDFKICYMGFEYDIDHDTIDLEFGHAIRQMYREIKKVLLGKIVTISYLNNKTNRLDTAEMSFNTPFLEIDADKIKYTIKEKQFLETRRCSFNIWSGQELTQNQKYYFIGILLTNHPDLRQAHTENLAATYLELNNEKILYTGKKSKHGIKVDAMQSVLLNFVILLALSVFSPFGLFGGTTVFLITLGGFVAFSVLASLAMIPVYLRLSKNIRYFVTNLRVVVSNENLEGGNITESKKVWYKDIDKVFITGNNIRILSNFKFKKLVKKIENPENLNEVFNLINSNVERLENFKFEYAKKFEDSNKQNQFIKAYNATVEAFRLWNPYLHIYVTPLNPTQEFGIEVASVAEFVIDSNDKNAIADHISLTFKRFLAIQVQNPLLGADIILQLYNSNMQVASIGKGKL